MLERWCEALENQNSNSKQTRKRRTAPTATRPDIKTARRSEEITAVKEDKNTITADDTALHTEAVTEDNSSYASGADAVNDKDEAVTADDVNAEGGVSNPNDAGDEDNTSCADNTAVLTEAMTKDESYDVSGADAVNDKDEAVTADDVSDADGASGAYAASDANDTDDTAGGRDAEGYTLLDDADVPVSEGEENENDGTDMTDAENAGTAECASAEEKKGTERTRKIDWVFDMLELFVFTLTAVFIITSFFFRYSIVDGSSMDQTLADNQKLILTNFMYEPEQFDIVVVYSEDLGKPIVKRIIAVGGQKVRISKTGITVDGVELDESAYVYIDPLNTDSFENGEYVYDVTPSAKLTECVDDIKVVEGRYFEFTVPEGELFLMGDHRNNSEDSRRLGTIDEDAIIGKVILRFYPFDQFGKVE